MSAEIEQVIRDAVAFGTPKDDAYVYLRALARELNTTEQEAAKFALRFPATADINRKEVD